MRLLRPDVARSPFGGYTAWRGPTSVAALVEDAEWLRYQDMHASGDIRRLQNVHGAALLTELGVQVAITGLSTAAGVGALGYHAQMGALAIGAGFSADAAGTAFGSGNYGEGTAHAALSVTAAFSLGSNIASSVASRAGLSAGKGAPYEFGRSLHQGHGVRAAHAAANPAGRRAAVTGPPQGSSSVTESARGSQPFTADLTMVTGRAVQARERAIRAVIREDLPHLHLTYQPQYSPFINHGVAQKGTGTQIGKMSFESRQSLRNTIVHEELHHRWWKPGILDHHPQGSMKEMKFYLTIERYERLRGWK